MGKELRAGKKNSEVVWLACSAGVFFGRANVFARESSMMAATALKLEGNLPFLLCFILNLRGIFQVKAPGGLTSGGAI